MKKLAVIGAGGHGRVVAEAAELSHWDSIVFFDDKWPSHSTTAHWTIQGTIQQFLSSSQNFDGVIVAIGNNSIRQQTVSMLLKANAPLTTIIHPQSIVSKHARIALGTVVLAGAVINIGAKIGMASIINTSSSIDHDCNIGDFVHICPGAHLAGHVTIKNSSWVGIGSAIIENITVGQCVMIGASTTVINDIGDNLTVIGSPAKPMEKLPC